MAPNFQGAYLFEKDVQKQGRQGETKNASPRGSGGSKSELSESNLGVFRWLLSSHVSAFSDATPG